MILSEKGDGESEKRKKSLRDCVCVCEELNGDGAKPDSCWVKGGLRTVPPEVGDLWRTSYHPELQGLKGKERAAGGESKKCGLRADPSLRQHTK